MITLIFLISLLIFTIINFLQLLNIKYNNDLFLKKEDICNSNSKILKLEIETYNYNIYNYDYDLSEYKSLFIINSLTFGTVILGLINGLFNKIDFTKTYVLILYISVFISFFLYVKYCGIDIFNYTNNNKNSKELKKYEKIYKIFNVGIKFLIDENISLKYNDKSIETKTVKDTIKDNISYYKNETNIDDYYQEAYVNLDLVKYLSMDPINSRYYYNYFNDNEFYFIIDAKYTLNRKNDKGFNPYDDINNSGNIFKNNFKIIRSSDDTIETNENYKYYVYLKDLNYINNFYFKNKVYSEIVEDSKLIDTSKTLSNEDFYKLFYININDKIIEEVNKTKTLEKFNNNIDYIDYFIKYKNSHIEIKEDNTLYISYYSFIIIISNIIFLLLHLIYVKYSPYVYFSLLIGIITIFLIIIYIKNNTNG